MVRKETWSKTFSNECYIVKDGENLGKFDPNFDLGIFLSYFSKSKAYRVCNQNSKVIQKSYNLIIDDSRYTQEVVNYDILQEESIRGIPKTMDETRDTPKHTPENVVDPNKDIKPLEVAKPSEPPYLTLTP